MDAFRGTADDVVTALYCINGEPVVPACVRVGAPNCVLGSCPADPLYDNDAAKLPGFGCIGPDAYKPVGAVRSLGGPAEEGREGWLPPKVAVRAGAGLVPLCATAPPTAPAPFVVLTGMAEVRMSP
jgi:hypothetical protein